jgi:predicted ABC-type ATPase
MWIVAGPNGAGKSTAAVKILKNLGVADLKKLNADERTLELRAQYPEKSQHELNLLAAQRTDAEVFENLPI